MPTAPSSRSPEKVAPAFEVATAVVGVRAIGKDRTEVAEVMTVTGSGVEKSGFGNAEVVTPIGSVAEKSGDIDARPPTGRDVTAMARARAAVGGADATPNPRSRIGFSF